MASGHAAVSRQLQTLFSLGTAGALTDAELLERFTARSGAAAEAALAVLVERHGPLVLRVCRDVLGNPADAEDAFQATFLVLVRRAGSIRNRDSLASWLYGVALRVAACARSEARRRRRRETAAAGARAIDQAAVGCDDGLGPLLHEEVGRLPEKYRAAVLLCYWEGLTHEQAADRLRWPVGTVRSRLSWARRRLRTRLARRGLAPAVALSAFDLAPSASAATSMALVEATVQGGLQLAAGRVPAGVVTASAWGLTQGVIKTMILARWKIAAIALLTVGITTAGAGGLALQGDDEPQKPAAAPREATGPDAPGQGVEGDGPAESIWLSRDEYKRLQELLSTIQLQLLEVEALYRDRLADLKGRPAAVDPELLLHKRVKDALLKDPEVASLVKEIDLAQRKVDRVESQVRRSSDPSLLATKRHLENLKRQLEELGARKTEELMEQFREADQGNLALRKQKEEIEALRMRKLVYEDLLKKSAGAARQAERNAVKVECVRQELAALRALEDSVTKRIERLQEALGEARR